MNKFTKLNDREIEDILIEIPGDDGGLTDLKDINDNDLIEENNYLDFLDSSTNIQTSVINIMEFSEEAENIAGPSNAVPMHNPIFEDGLMIMLMTVLKRQILLNVPYWNKGMKVFFDNYFTSINLLEKLNLENTFACGTIRSNRKGIPLLSQDKTLERGMYDFKTSRLGITVYKWKDNRIVHLASNFHGVEESSLNESKLSVLQFRRGVAQGLITQGKSGIKRTTDISPGTSKGRPCLQPRRGQQLFSTTSDVRLGNLGAHWLQFVEPKQRTTKSLTSRRSGTYFYYLKVGNSKFCVCRNMFLNTFGSKESTIRHWLEKGSLSENILPKNVREDLGIVDEEIECEMETENDVSIGHKKGNSRRAKNIRTNT
ncbi:hypothetical protein QTP88_001852 [Uroleucon formosanum]